MFREFKEFALRGNAIDLAVGIVIGAAFNLVINSLVTDIISPVLGFLTGHLNFANLKFHLAGETYITYGVLLNAIINFLLVAFTIFILVKQINRFRRQEAPNEKICQFCKTPIAILATRCPACTSELN